MTERADRPQDPNRDLSKLVEQSMSTLQEVDRRLQVVRSDLAALMGRAAMLQGQAGLEGLGLGLGGPRFGPQGGLPLLGAPAFGGQGFAGQGFGLQQGFPPGFPPPGFPTQGFPAQGLGAAAPFGAQPPMAPGMGMQQNQVLPMGGTPTAGATGQGSPGQAPGARGENGRHQPPVPRMPNVDIVDQGEEFLVQIELPGVKKEDLDLMVSDRMVTLQAQSRPQHEEGVVLLNERPPTMYRRVIPLPAEVTTTKSKATFKDGILTLTVPKKVPTEGPRRLDVAYG
jgi:HSP20 family molecular chaperone IbpA